MEYELYVIYDVADEKYSFPMAHSNDAVAMRFIANQASDSMSLFNTHAQDYILYKVGIFNLVTGELTSYPNPERVCSAADLVRKEK